MTPPEPCVWDGCKEPRLARSLYCAAHNRRMATFRRDQPNDHTVTPVAPRGLNGHAAAAVVRRGSV